jgi:hypothetical protein
MNYIYQEVTDTSGTKSIKRTDEDGIETFFNLELDNSDYQEYLKHIEESNNG